MQKHFIYITSDANRIYLEAGYCQDLDLQLFEIQQAKSNFMNSTPKFSRIVYMEEYESFEAAQKRKMELNSYTKMKKERLIRRKNPNWLGIQNLENTAHKKVVVYV